MKRLQYHRFGGPEEMRLEPFDLPPLRKGEVLVRVKAASVNPFDWKLRGGYMKLMVRGSFPRGMGADFAGVVESIGQGVTAFRRGDEVMGTVPLPGGALAEQAITTDRLVVKKPATLSWEVAAALPTVGVTAWHALLVAGKLKAGQRVFINGALGGIGHVATHLALGMGAHVTGRVGRAALDEAMALGLTLALDYTQPLPANVLGTFDLVFDTSGGLTVAEGDALVKRGGLVIDVVPTSGKVLRSLVSPSRKFLMSGPNVGTLQNLVDLTAQGSLPLSVGRTVRLSEASALITELESGRRTSGKAVVVMTERPPEA
jgi:NADPH:quinone reductase-like Zn-dependent oxidoreductase